MRALIASTASLQLIVELYATGQAMGPTSSSSSSTQLELLKKRTYAWSNLRYTKEQSIPMSEGDLWELYGGVLAQTVTASAVTFHRLPSLWRSIKESEWTLDGFGFSILLMKDMHIVSTCDVWTMGNITHWLAMQLSHHTDEDHEFHLWDWKTGVVEMVVFGIEIQSFAFLSQTEVMFALIEEDEEGGIVLSLLVIDFKKESNEKHAITKAEHGFSLLLPHLHEETEVLRMELRSDPAPTFSPCSQQELPFYTASNNRLFTTSLNVFSARGRYNIVFCAPLSTVRSCLDRRVAGQKFAEWSTWGPRGARALVPSRHPSDDSDAWPGYANDCVMDANVFQAHSVFQEEIRTSLPYRLQTLTLDAEHTSDTAVMCTEDHLIIVDNHMDGREYRVLSF
ncbi:hypothetical protein DXG01_011856 [Tephrocybe rancida]|nr:hypothetical protein DXG01_011856 [Tephrocybe rancida]